MIKKSKSDIITIIVLALTIACTAFFWLTGSFGAKDSGSSVTALCDGWYYINEAGETVFVSLPCQISAGKELTLFLDADDAVTANAVLATNAADYDVALYVGEQCIYKFEDNGQEINSAVRGNIVCYGAIPSDAAQGGIRVVYHSESGSYNLPEITVSTEGALFKSIFLQSAFTLFIAVAMLIIGAFAIICSMAIATQKEHDKRILHLGLFLITSGLWCLSDSSFIFLLTGYSETVFSIDFYLFMLMPIPLSYFILNSGEMRKHRMLRCVPLLYYANIIAQSLLAAFGVFTFFKMLFCTHFLIMFSGVICSLYVLLKEQYRQKTSEGTLAVRALASVGIIGMVAIVLYELIGYSAYQLFYQTGLLLLMSVLLTALLKEFIRSVRYRAEARIYKRLSEQDKLTKLDNRRSFDAMLEKLRDGSIRYENAVLLFMDVNFLKKANDSFGHDFGDKLLISAATCIQSAFGSAGYCYRIGGDEFCAVILDPSRPADELTDSLQAEIQEFNRENTLHIPLSIACGCSFITEGGKTKTIDEWTAEADQRMYRHKSQTRATRDE